MYGRLFYFLRDVGILTGMLGAFPGPVASRSASGTSKVNVDSAILRSSLRRIPASPDKLSKQQKTVLKGAVFSC